jgi:CRISPR-associated protein Csd1
MILHALNDLYDRLADDPAYEVAAPGYSLQKISYVVVVDADGRLSEIQDARRDVEGRMRPRQLLVPGSTKSSGSGLNPCFLWDNTGYMLGYRPDDRKPERTRQTFEAFRQRHLGAERAVSSPAFSAVCRFLEAWKPKNAREHLLLTDEIGTGFGVFRIRGQERYVHEDPAVKRWWDGQSATHDPITGQCLVTGRESALARTHDKVRGVAGAQSAGAAIVGFNAPAYESYGKSQSYNAPVSEDVAFRYVTALNSLLDGPQREKHRVVLGDTTIAFWTDRRNAVEDIFLEFAASGSAILEKIDVQDEKQRQKVEFFLRAIRKGRPAYGDLAPGAVDTRFFILALAPNAARISVRFFWQASLGSLLDNVRRHHRDIGLDPSPPAGKWRGDPEMPGIRALLAQTAREPKDVPSTLEAPLIRAIITGSPYPAALYAAVLRRIRADRTVNYLRCCVIKGYLTRSLNMEVTMALDPERPDPAYRLGRLFAALEKTQKDALGEGLNTTIRDTFYSSASATPGSVFPRLLRTYQHHLGKLEGGLKVNRERLVQEILGSLDALPTHLTLPAQGLFALGYYHQTRDFYTKRTKPAHN